MDVVASWGKGGGLGEARVLTLGPGITQMDKDPFCRVEPFVYPEYASMAYSPAGIKGEE